MHAYAHGMHRPAIQAGSLAKYDLTGDASKEHPKENFKGSEYKENLSTLTKTAVASIFIPAKCNPYTIVISSPSRPQDTRRTSVLSQFCVALHFRAIQARVTASAHGASDSVNIATLRAVATHALPDVHRALLEPILLVERTVLCH